ncbi:MAG: glycosyltransferase family 1 protein, partial [Ginsengibacter sp.]
NGNDFTLVITDCSKDYIENLLKEIKHPELINRIQILNYISFTEVPFLYNLSKIFLYPSHRESFGMPVVEAMACGIPVITSNTSALPEIAGGAAILVDPRDENEMAKHINKLITDAELYNSYKEKGLTNAQRFNWSDAAKKTLEIYKELS